MPGGGGAAAFKGAADAAEEALGNAGHALGDFVENTAQTADKTTDAMLATEEHDTQTMANMMSEDAASQEKATASVAETLGPAPSSADKFSDILDPKGASAWDGEGGLHLNLEENAAADRFLAQATDAESNITPVVMGIRDEVPGAETVGYPDFALKSPEPFKRKLATELSSESPTRTFEVQFHTRESFEAKMVTHELCEQMRIPGVPQTRILELEA